MLRMVRKSDTVRSLVAQKQYKQALRIAKDFRLGITAEQSLRMKKAYECMVHERFYYPWVKILKPELLKESKRLSASTERRV